MDKATSVYTTSGPDPKALPFDPSGRGVTSNKMPPLASPPLFCASLLTSSVLTTLCMYTKTHTQVNSNEQSTMENQHPDTNTPQPGNSTERRQPGVWTNHDRQPRNEKRQPTAWCIDQSQSKTPPLETHRRTNGRVRVCYFNQLPPPPPPPLLYFLGFFA